MTSKTKSKKPVDDKKMKTAGKKGGRMMMGAAIGGFAGVAIGSVAGAVLADSETREKAKETIGTAVDYTTSAAEAIQEHQDEIKDTMGQVSDTGKHMKKAVASKK